MSNRLAMFVVLMGLLIGAVAVDIDHFIIVRNGSISFSTIECMWYGFLSITSYETRVCVSNKLYGSRLLHDARVGLFLFGFVLSHYIVLKHGGWQNVLDN